MLWVLLIAAGLWFVGRALGASVAARVAVLVMLLAAVLFVQLALPPENPLRAATGGSARAWAILLGAAGVAIAYVWGLRLLRRRVAPAEKAPPQPGVLSDSELDRYARHIVLREIGGPGQRRLKQARVLVVGAGGLGAPALLYLGAAGVGTLGVIDDDTVSVSNLQRQVIHTDARQGTAKVFSARATLAALNPHVAVRPYNRRLTDAIAADLFADYDLVLDGSDSFETRTLVNAATVAAGIPLISGAIAQWEGQLSLYDPARGGPCYACVFPEAPAPGLAPSCAEAGVVGALPGVIGSMMALEAVKLIAGAGAGLRGRLQLYDGLWGETRMVATRPRPGCPVCGAGQGRGASPDAVAGQGGG
jgi:molybdopterin/thiamine biosynthesis adenylyltransferase